jgi:hypothetical protein
VLPLAGQISKPSRNKLGAFFGGILQHSFSVHLISCRKKVSDVDDLRPEAIWCEAGLWNGWSAERENVIYRAIEKQAL